MKGERHQRAQGLTAYSSPRRLFRVRQPLYDEVAATVASARKPGVPLSQ